MFGELKTTVPMAVPLLFYFYLKPDILPEFAALFYCVWAVGFFLDARVTVSNSHLLSRERNLIFPLLHRRFGSGAVIVQFLIECAFVALIGFLFERSLSIASMSAVSLVFGAAHIEAYCANRATVRRSGRA